MKKCFAIVVVCWLAHVIFKIKIRSIILFWACVLAFVYVVGVIIQKRTPQEDSQQETKTNQQNSLLVATPRDEKRAEKLLERGKYYAGDINRSVDVQDFVYSYNKLMEILKELITLNEDKNVFMTPTPRYNLQKIESNMEATVNDFFSRAVGEIRGSGSVWSNSVDSLLTEVESNSCFLKLMTAENRKRIAQLRKQAQDSRENEKLRQERVREMFYQQRTREVQRPSSSVKPLAPIDYEQIIRDENEWRRAQAGKSPIEAEMEKVDGMDGRTFEKWCADLFREAGFYDVEVTKASGDQGVDVLATLDGERYAIQCKCYSSDLGNKPIQEVYAGRMFYDCQVGGVITNRYFTPGARELAEKTGVYLWDRDWIISMLSEIFMQEGQ